MAANSSVVSAQNHEGQVIVSVDGFDVIECVHCGFTHVSPLPTAEQLAEVYSHDYYNQEKPLYIERYTEDLDWWNAVYASRFEILESYLSSVSRSILDIGSGPGYFLLSGKSRGWLVKGVEPSLKAAEHSVSVLGLNVENVFFNAQTAAMLPSFDAINISLILEHIPDPASFLRLVWNQLNPGGMVCVVVPNDFNPFQKVLSDHLGFQPWWVAPPHHLNYFNHNSLRKLVECIGFEVKHVESTFPIDMFLLMGQNYIGDEAKGREVHELRKKFELSLLGAEAGRLISDLYGAFANVGIGREVVLFAQKP